MKELDAFLLTSDRKQWRNVITLLQVKVWPAEYLRDYAEEMEQFPSERGKSHWDLLVADYAQNEDAMFVLVLAFFSSVNATFLVGFGKVAEVRAFAENEFPTNPGEVIAELSRRFSIGGQADVGNDELRDSWQIGRWSVLDVDDFATGSGRNGPIDCDINRLADELYRTIADGELSSTRVTATE
jgi:hypothetical protein